MISWTRFYYFFCTTIVFSTEFNKKIFIATFWKVLLLLSGVANEKVDTSPYQQLHKKYFNLSHDKDVFWLCWEGARLKTWELLIKELYMSNIPNQVQEPAFALQKEKFGESLVHCLELWFAWVQGIRQKLTNVCHVRKKFQFFEQNQYTLSPNLASCQFIMILRIKSVRYSILLSYSKPIQNQTVFLDGRNSCSLLTFWHRAHVIMFTKAMWETQVYCTAFKQNLLVQYSSLFWSMVIVYFLVTFFCPSIIISPFSPACQSMSSPLHCSLQNKKELFTYCKYKFRLRSQKKLPYLFTVANNLRVSRLLLNEFWINVSAYDIVLQNEHYCTLRFEVKLLGVQIVAWKWF